MDMNVNKDITRGRSTFFSRNRSRESSILLNVSLIVYYKQMEILNKILPDEIQAKIDSS